MQKPAFAGRLIAERKILDAKQVLEFQAYEEAVNNALKYYAELKWDLVPVRRNGKEPFEMDWPKVPHTDIVEWYKWLDSDLNMGVKTGKISNVLILDFDSNDVPEPFKSLLQTYKGFMQRTKKGWHFAFAYDQEIPNSNFEVAGCHVDVRSDGGQVVVFPSVVEGVERKVLSMEALPTLPADVKAELLKYVNVKKAPAEDKLTLDGPTLKLKNNGLEGCCNSTFIKLGGGLLKQLSASQTSQVLNYLNRNLLEDPMDSTTMSSMMGQIQKYFKFEEKDLAERILQYLKVVKEADARDVKEVMAESKEKTDRALAYLVKEGAIIKHRRVFQIINRANWKTALNVAPNRVPFKVPYFDHVAYFNWGDMILVGAQTKTGKCFKRGTKILLNNGQSKEVQDIIVGDTLQGINNQHRKVLDVCEGFGKLYKIKPVNNTPFIVNGEHILCLEHTQTNKQVNISVEDYLKKNKTFKHLYKLYADKVDNWLTKETELDPYFVGLWLGDGATDGSRITNVDKEVIEYLESYANSLGYQLTEYKQPNKTSSYNICSPKVSWQNKYDIMQRLRKYNLIGNKHIPNDFKINSRENRLKLLAGLIDSDGWLDKKTHNYGLGFKLEQLAKDTVFLAQSLGFSAQYKARKTNMNTISYQFSIVGNVAEIPVKIKRKKSDKSSSIKDCRHSGFMVTELNEDNYYGFILDGDHKFLLDNFIVSHNTHIAMNIIKQLVDQGIKPDYLSSESGSRFQQTAVALKMGEGDFRWDEVPDPTSIELEPKSVTIIDWLQIEDKSMTDTVLKHFTGQLIKTQGLLFIFMQLKETDGGWFAPNMVAQYPALAARYSYDDETGLLGKWNVKPIREPKTHKKSDMVPCRYDPDTKILAVNDG